MKKMLMAAVAAFAAQSAGAAGLPSLGPIGAISLGSAIPSLQSFPLPVLDGFALGDIPVVGGYEFGVTVSQLVATGLDAPALPGSLSATFLPIVTGGSSADRWVWYRWWRVAPRLRSASFLPAATCLCN
jgi:hypothetical protein